MPVRRGAATQQVSWVSPLSEELSARVEAGDVGPRPLSRVAADSRRGSPRLLRSRLETVF